MGQQLGALPAIPEDELSFSKSGTLFWSACYELCLLMIIHCLYLIITSKSKSLLLINT